MLATRLQLSSLDHGRELALDEYEEAEYAPGFHYEIIEGRLYVSPLPNVPENLLESWLRRKIERYMDLNAGVVGYVTPKGRVFVSTDSMATVPEPDIAVYGPLDLETTDWNDIHWQDLMPFLVCEVLVEGDFDKDLTRNPALYRRVRSIREYWVLNGSQSVMEPTLIVHTRRGKAWAVAHYPYGSTYTTKILPGFELLVDPRK